MTPQLFTTQDGINCRPANPFEKPQFTGGAYDFDTKWKDFEQSVQHYPIHSPNPIKGEFWGEVVWQYYSESQERWFNGDMKPFSTYESFKACAEENGEKTRIAVQPVPVKGEEKSKPDSGYEEVDILDKKSYNLGIDAAMKVAQGLPYETPLLIDRLLKIKEISEQNTYGPSNDNYGRDKKLPQTKLSVEEAAEQHFKLLNHNPTEFEYGLFISGYQEAQIAYLRKIVDTKLTSSNMVELDRVVEVLTDLKGLFRNRACFDTAITQIKNLTKE